MKLLVDIGNTSTKMALAENGRFELIDASQLPSGVTDAWVSVSGNPSIIDKLEDMGVSVHQLSANSDLPIHIDYATPSTLGPDRIASACAAWSLCGNACVVIDAGTCITVDYVDSSGTFAGGAILPGIYMRNKAMHNFTSRLPLINIDNRDLVYTGKSTHDSLWAGVATATKFELEGFVAYYRQHGGVDKVYVTGGDAEIVASWIGAECVKDMVLKGLLQVSNRES